MTSRSQFDRAETDLFTPRHDVYPFIDPAPLVSARSFSGKVILITGASSGIGAATALLYARAGAHLVLVARSADKLAARKAEIEAAVSGAKVVLVVGDVAKPETSPSAVKAAVEAFGKVDIVLANSAVAPSDTKRLADKDPLEWWYVQEVNVRGVLSVIHAAIPELLKTQGQIFVTTSASAHGRWPAMSAYSISKHTINRLIELTALDYPELVIYGVHPGRIGTDGAKKLLKGLNTDPDFPDSLELVASTFVWLSAHKEQASFLSGRYFHATWDLEEVLAAKKKIVEGNLLVTKLAG